MPWGNLFAKNWVILLSTYTCIPDFGIYFNRDRFNGIYEQESYQPVKEIKLIIRKFLSQQFSRSYLIADQYVTSLRGAGGNRTRVQTRNS